MWQTIRFSFQLRLRDQYIYDPGITKHNTIWLRAHESEDFRKHFVRRPSTCAQALFDMKINTIKRIIVWVCPVCPIASKGRTN